MSNLKDLLDQFNQKQSSVLPKAIISNLGLWAGVSLGTVILFNILRPRNKIIYEPKSKYHVGDKKPPKIDDGFFSWISPLIHSKEDQLLDKVGLDAVAFLRFLRMMRWIFLIVSALCCGILIPVDVLYNMNNVEVGIRNSLSMLTVADVRDETLYAHVALTYVINGVVLALVYINWNAMVRLRWEWFRSAEYQKSFYARTLMVLQAPKQLQSDQGIADLFGSLQVPYPATSVHIGRRVGQLPDLIEYHNQTVREFEQVLVRYLKGGKLAKKRPTITIGGFMGCGGQKKDAIEFYTRKLARTEAAVKEWRDKSEYNKVENYGFASMAAVPYAHVVAQRLEGKHPKGTTITLAPNPKDIIWKNLTMSDSTRSRQNLIGWLWLGLVCFINTVPLLVISILANLSNIAAYYEPLEQWQADSEWTFALVSGILPPTVSAIFSFILPRIMRRLSQYQGAITHSRLDRAVIARYFAFLIISQLIIFSLLGVILKLSQDVIFKIEVQKSFLDILKDIRNSDITLDIHKSYISLAPYWLTFFPLRGFLVIFDLAQLVNVVWIWFKTRLFGRTPRDIREWTQPPEFEYAIYYSNLLFMAAVGLLYAPLAPLVTLAATVVFWISSVVNKYQLMFVFISKVESGGRLWNVVVNRLLACLIFMQLMMTLTVGLADGWDRYNWAACVPPIFIVLGCKIWWNRRFLTRFTHYVPEDKEMAEVIVHSQSTDNKGNRLEKRFGHPAITTDLFTPMLHAKMMPLLAQVYHGRLGTESTTMKEYGGQKLDAQIAPGGLRIAAVEQNDLEYDLRLYQRDRGELDWDNRSIMSSNILGDGSTSLSHSKSGYYAPANTGRQPEGYDQYLKSGPSQFEMSRMSRIDMNGSEMDLPLLATTRSNLSLSQPSPGGMSSGHGHERSLSNMEMYGPPGYGRTGTPQPGPPSSYFPPPQPQYSQQQPPSRSGSPMGMHRQTPSAGPNDFAGHARSGSAMGMNRVPSPGPNELGGYGQHPGPGMGMHRQNPSAGPNDFAGYAQRSGSAMGMNRVPSPGPNELGGYGQQPGPGMGMHRQNPSAGPNDFAGYAQHPGPAMGMHRQNPSAGPNDFAGYTQQYQRSGSSMGYHQQHPSMGPNDFGGAAYPPQQQAGYRPQGGPPPGAYAPAGEPRMAPLHRPGPGPAGGYRHQDGGDMNNAGRGARQNQY